MKKIVYIIICFLVMASTVVAEEKKENIVSTNVFNFIISTFGIEYERVINQNWGLQGSFRYGSYKIGDFNVNWPGFTAGARWYTNGEAPAGFFIGPSIYANLMSIDFKLGTVAETISATFIGPMAELGYKWIWGNVTLYPSTIVGYLSGEAKSAKTGQKLSYGGTALGLGLNIGIVF